MALVFSRDVAWNHTCNELRFSQNFQDKPRNFGRVFTRAFLQPPCTFFFSLEQTTDRQIDLLFWVLRYPAYCTALELLLERPKNDICYRYHPKYTFFSCFAINYFNLESLQSESLYFNEIGVTYAIFDVLQTCKNHKIFILTSLFLHLQFSCIRKILFSS